MSRYKRFNITIIITVCLIIFDVTLTHSKTIIADSISEDDVRIAIDSAEKGDMVIIPAGNAKWANTIVVNDGVSIKGMGIGKSVITWTRFDWTLNLLEFTLTNDTCLTISELTFIGPSISYENHSNFVFIGGKSGKFRIFNCEFLDGGAHSLVINGNIYGVIDHCSFVNDSQESISIWNGNGERTWLEKKPLGTIEAVFIEDCEFRFEEKGDHAVTSINGGRYVFRYNNITSLKKKNSTQIDTHGNFFAERGGYSSEIYCNTLTSEESYYGMYIRGGTGVIFNNKFIGKFYIPICFANYGSFRSKKDKKSGLCGFQECSYPAIDQINDFYIWNNVYNERSVGVVVQKRGLEREHIKVNRDYFEKKKKGYEEFEYPHPLTKYDYQ